MSRRSELKENILANKLEGVVKWSLDHRPIVITLMAGALMAILISSVFIIRGKQQGEFDWTRLAQAQILISQNNIEAAEQILAEIKNTSPDPHATYHASFYLGEIKLKEEEYDLAVEHFGDVVSRAGKSPIRPLALSNLGFSYEQKKEFGIASQTYRQFMEEYPEHFLAARVQMLLGRSLADAGDTEAAKEALTTLIDLYPTSPWAKNAREILDKLKSR